MKSLNSIFSNIHQMVYNWPDRHKLKHLKHEDLSNLIEEREAFSTKLQHHLDKQHLCYKDAVLEINTRDSDQEILAMLGDFILAAISLTLGIPIFLVYPTVEQSKDNNDRPVVTNAAHTEYLFCKDANRAKNQTLDLLVVVYNGIDYYAPTAPKEVAPMMRNCTAASTHIEDAIDLVSKIVEDLLPSNTCVSLSKSVKLMRAVDSHLEGTSLATGTTVVASLPVDVPIPKVTASYVVMKTVHKRVAASIGQVPPEKQSTKTEEVFVKQKKTYKDTVTKVAARDTKLAENQCPCSESFNTMKKLLQHQHNAHLNDKAWKCTQCDSIFNCKGHCWSHAHKHLGHFFFYCNCTYKDEKDCDANRNPKEKICEKGFDKVLNVEFHCEMKHGMGKASCQCDYCDKPQQSMRRKKEHHAICDSSPNKDGGPTHWCDIEDCSYLCRGTSTLKKHMATDHHAEFGLPAPKRWKCRHCGKECYQHNRF